MLIEIYLALQIIGILCLLVCFIPIGLKGRKVFQPSVFALVIFMYLAFGSADIQTENCDYLINQTVVNASTNTTTYTYYNDCETTSYFDTPQMYFNMGLAFVSLVTMIGMAFLRGAESYD